MKIAVLGPEGTFCDKACIEYKNNCRKQGMCSDGLEPVYYPTIDEVFTAVCSDKEMSDSCCALGIVPIENTLDGYVQRTLDLLLETDVHIIDENVVPVQFSLVANAESVEQIKRLYVQFKANGQCRKFINSLHEVEIITTESNMESYYRIRDEQGAAAIVPRHIADNENRRFVIENVTDADKNYTRFIVFKCGSVDAENISKSEGKCKIRIPVYVMPETERPGILFEILKGFHENRINLISIMSRPTKQEMGTYNFYMEIDGLAERLDEILDTLKQIRVYNNIKILGIYYE